jgi:DNA/RNA-binding domain of Phe-tRNA-synthetase-like protein
MNFQHDPAIWRDFPELAAGTISIGGIHPAVDVAPMVARYSAIAADRLHNRTESELPEIRAWRRTFAKMGLKPTQYRCASESLLRRFRKEGSLPQIHPLIDLCNAVSLAYAIPIAVFDRAQITGDLTVRYASGDENYLTFGDETEHPTPGEVIFADTAGNAHARRWTNRQSGLSGVQASTADVLIVSEAMHETASADIAALIANLAEEIAPAWGGSPVTGFPKADSSIVEIA